MGNKIYLPSEEQERLFIEGAWKDFCKRMKESGLDGEVLRQKDLFAAGYFYGGNDMLNIVRDQFTAEYVANKTMNEGRR